MSKSKEKPPPQGPKANNYSRRQGPAALSGAKSAVPNHPSKSIQSSHLPPQHNINNNFKADTANAKSTNMNSNGISRRHRSSSAKQLYRRYVNKSNLFAESTQMPASSTHWAGRWQIGTRNGGAPFRLSDSMPSANQLEWQKGRRVQARQLAMNAPGSVNGPKIVQKHAEMRSYLMHCQRVLNARPRVDTGRSAGNSGASSSITTSPSVAEVGSRNAWDDSIGGTIKRAKSVPAYGRQRRVREVTEFERELQEENRRLLERLLQISNSSNRGTPSGASGRGRKVLPNAMAQPPSSVQSRKSIGAGDTNGFGRGATRQQKEEEEEEDEFEDDIEPDDDDDDKEERRKNKDE